MAWYRAGTATFTNGSRSVVGIGTAWVGNVRPGDEIIGPNGASHEVETITSDTALTMVETYAGTTATAAYKVKPTQGWARDVSVQLAQLLNDYGTIEAALNVLNGNLGIGTATPTSNGSTYRNLDLRGSGGGGGFVYAGETTAKARFGYAGAAGGGLIEMLAAEPLIVRTSTAEAWRTDSNGNVGIGTTSPNAKLVVAGGFRIAGTATLGSAVGAGTFSLDDAGANFRAYVGDGTGYTWNFSKRTASVTTELMTITDSGKVGIGIAPAVKLDVGTSGDAAATMLRMQSGGFATTVSHDTIATVIANNSAARGIALAPNGTTRLLADNSGVRITGTVRMDVATQTTSPSAGGAGALPATPAGYMTINVGGTDRKVPYYA